MKNSLQHEKPLVVVTGAAGNIGSDLIQLLDLEYKVVSIDVPNSGCDIEVDLSHEDAVKLIDLQLEPYVNASKSGSIAAVVHLAAYFDFSGEESPLYKAVNEQGTKHLIESLKSFTVERFIYSSTMLVHKPGEIGEAISEDSPIEPKWAYPKSKARTEKIIEQQCDDIPYTLLRLAGMYDESTAVPTLAHQISRIYERDMHSILYAGEVHAGQAFIHKKDMLNLFVAAINKRNEMPNKVAILAGESNAHSYQYLQDRIGALIHGAEEWKTLSLPKTIAKAGAWIEEKAESLIPDELDEGKEPFIKPFMIDMASDHYDLDTRRAQQVLDWNPQYQFQTELQALIKSLLDDPMAWYRKNNIHPPAWIKASASKNKNAEKVRKSYDLNYLNEHKKHIWAPLLNIALGFWLMSSPAILNYGSSALGWSDVISGFLIAVLAGFSLSSRYYFRHARWGIAAIGVWLLMAPLVFWAPTAQAYLNDTIVGTLVFAFALVVRPFPALSPVAAQCGPEVPPGWDFSPSDWYQRVPIIALAFVGFYISRYLAAYQLEHTSAVWDPFFSGSASLSKNGTEEIITSSVSKAWPVPDAGIGAVTYLLEILTGLIGSRARWRTMPWLVLLFGFMIVPLGAISITFIIIQPIVLDTWCTLCLVAAAAMLLQIPYSFDEIVATIDFLKRRARAGRPWMLILFTGDTDEGERKTPEDADNFQQPAFGVLKEILAGGVSAPWSLIVCAGVGIWLMFSRVTLGNDGAMANADHLIGALVLTITVTAFAEVMRSIRFLNIFLGMALFITPFVFTVSLLGLISSLVCGSILIFASIPRGEVQHRYGQWSETII